MKKLKKCLKNSKENVSPDINDGKKYNSINSKYQRSNKKRQNLRYDRKSLDKMNVSSSTLFHLISS